LIVSPPAQLGGRSLPRLEVSDGGGDEVIDEAGGGGGLLTLAAVRSLGLLLAVFSHGAPPLHESFRHGLKEDTLYPAAVGLGDVLSHPIGAEHVSCDLNDGVIGLRPCIVVVPRQSLQA
jgi:hypothetical protein